MRRYNVKAPSFETLNYIALFGVIYYIVFNKLINTGVNNFKTTSKLIQALSTAIN
jgi:hypothetical protein